MTHELVCTANCLEIPRDFQISRRRLEYPADLNPPSTYSNFSVIGTSPLVISFKNAAFGLYSMT